MSINSDGRKVWILKKQVLMQHKIFETLKEASTNESLERIFSQKQFSDYFLFSSQNGWPNSASFDHEMFNQSVIR